MAEPTLASLRVYLGDSSSYSDAVVTAALAAEKDAQASVCRIPLVWPDDLAEALCRRVARNLAMKALPLGLQTAMSEMTVSTIKVGSDSEVRRLEAPYRRVTVG